jgi:uncharacterized protein YjbI with pentapeptide repeats
VSFFIDKRFTVEILFLILLSNSVFASEGITRELSPCMAFPGVKCEQKNLSFINWENQNLRQARLGGSNLRFANLVGANLEKANLAKADLTGANLTGAHLSSANLEGAILTGANFNGADLSFAYFHRILSAFPPVGCALAKSDAASQRTPETDISLSLIGANLEGIFAESADFSGANFSGANLYKAEFIDAKLNYTKFNDARIEKANFYRASLICSSLVGVQAAKANFSESNLDFSKMLGGDFSGAYFLNATLTRVDGRRSIFAESNLRGAALGSSLMQEANFRKANLDHTNLGIGDIFYATNFSFADLREASFVGSFLEGIVLGNALLDNATWVNRDICAPSSIGVCNIKSSKLNK